MFDRQLTLWIWFDLSCRTGWIPHVITGDEACFLRLRQPFQSLPSIRIWRAHFLIICILELFQFTDQIFYHPCRHLACIFCILVSLTLEKAYFWTTEWRKRSDFRPFESIKSQTRSRSMQMFWKLRKYWPENILRTTQVSVKEDEQSCWCVNICFQKTRETTTFWQKPYFTKIINEIYDC